MEVGYGCMQMMLLQLQKKAVDSGRKMVCTEEKQIWGKQYTIIMVGALIEFLLQLKVKWERHRADNVNTNIV